MDALGNQAVKQKQLERLLLKREQLTYVTQRIDHEDFGECQFCLQAIPLERLLLVPECRFCVECAQNGR